MDGKRLIRSIRLENILSYGPETPAFDLEPLNVLIGPNASGKSNLIEALSILGAAPRDIQEPFRQGGGVHEWLWKGSDNSPTATIEVAVEVAVSYLAGSTPFRYRLSFTDNLARFVLRDEVVEDEYLDTPAKGPLFYYQYLGGQPVIKVGGESLSERRIERGNVRFDQSILSQWRDFGSLSLANLTSNFESIRLYREFQLGHNTPLRRPQQADLPQDYLLEDGSNLAVVLSYLLNQPRFKEWLLRNLQDFYPAVKDILVVVLGGTAQIFFQEEGLNQNVPATRLSDGSLRYLCLLVALYNPEPPSVICIEEPEMGLHPDAIPQLAKLLVEASKRSQIIVTTHSDILVDALTDTPEAVIICEKVEGATQLRRLDADKLKVWLDKYRLGELWTRGQLGGNLW